MHRLENDKVYRHFIERTRLGSWHKLFLYGTIALLWFSGLTWVLLHYFGVHQSAFGPSVSPVETVSLKFHGAAAIVFTLVLGSLIPAHMRRGWALRRNRRSGVVITSICGSLIATGWGLYYLAGENARAAVSLIHWVVGLLLPLIVYLHILAWRRESRILEETTAR